MYIQQSEIDFENFGVVAGETTWIGAWSCVKIETKYEMKKSHCLFIQRSVMNIKFNCSAFIFYAWNWETQSLPLHGLIAAVFDDENIFFCSCVVFLDMPAWHRNVRVQRCIFNQFVIQLFDIYLVMEN